MLDRRDLNEQNEIIADKALPGTVKKKRANKPNEFITNDDFCPGCSLQLKQMPQDENDFWTEIFQRELRDSDDPTVAMANGLRMGNPGVLLFRGWGLEVACGRGIARADGFAEEGHRGPAEEAEAGISVHPWSERRGDSDESAGELCGVTRTTWVRRCRATS